MLRADLGQHFFERPFNARDRLLQLLRARAFHGIDVQDHDLQSVAYVMIHLVEDVQALDLLLPAAHLSAQDEPGRERSGYAGHEVIKEQRQRARRAHVDQYEVEQDAYRENEQTKGVRSVARGANGEATGKKESAIHDKNLTVD